MTLPKKVLMFSCLLLSTALSAEPKFPTLQGKPLLDAAGIIPDEDELAINTKLTEITAKSKHQVMILITPSLGGEAISDYGYKAGRHYRIGNRDSDDGVLITIAPKERKSRMEVGYGLDSLLTDAKSDKIINGIMIPHFKKKDWVGGIDAGLDQLAKDIVPLSPEQLLIQQRQETNRNIRLEKEHNDNLNFLANAGVVLACLGGLVGLYLFLTRHKREEKRKAKRLAAIIQQEEIARLRVQKQLQRQKAIDDAAKARKEMLDAMSPMERAVFLQNEQDEIDRARQLAAQQEKERRDKQAERNSQSEQSSTGYAYIAGDNSDDSYEKKKERDDTPSINFFGDGGSFGGAGAEGSWDD